MVVGVDGLFVDLGFFWVSFFLYLVLLILVLFFKIEFKGFGFFV